jgi:hypothetical protein
LAKTKKYVSYDIKWSTKLPSFNDFHEPSVNSCRIAQRMTQHFAVSDASGCGFRKIYSKNFANKFKSSSVF